MHEKARVQHWVIEFRSLFRSFLMQSFLLPALVKVSEEGSNFAATTHHIGSLYFFSGVFFETLNADLEQVPCKAFD